MCMGVFLKRIPHVHNLHYQFMAVASFPSHFLAPPICPGSEATSLTCKLTSRLVSALLIIQNHACKKKKKKERRQTKRVSPFPGPNPINHIPNPFP